MLLQLKAIIFILVLQQHNAEKEKYIYVENEMKYLQWKGKGS